MGQLCFTEDGEDLEHAARVGGEGRYDSDIYEIFGWTCSE